VRGLCDLTESLQLIVVASLKNAVNSVASPKFVFNHLARRNMVTLRKWCDVYAVNEECRLLGYYAEWLL
jgi:hypothetical protein